MQLLWLTGMETSEPLGIPLARIVLIERKSGKEGHAVALHLDSGKEIRVIESLEDVKSKIEAVGTEKDFT